MANVPVNDRTLPFKLTAQPRGVQKAYAAMIQQYGVTEGRRIFLAKANEQGTGSTPRLRARSVYAKGAKLPVDTSARGR